MTTMTLILVGIVVLGILWVTSELNTTPRDGWRLSDREWDVFCPVCFNEYVVFAEWHGQTITCDQCLTTFEVEIR